MEIEEVIKWIIGIIVVVIVIVTASLFFKNQVFGFFQNLSVGKPSGIFLGMLKC